VPGPREILLAAIERWVADPDSAVVYAEEVDGRWAIRMTQETRDATTVWWTIGERTVSAEAYVMPAPPKAQDQVYRLCLVRNASTFLVRFALDPEGAIVLRSRIDNETLSDRVLDLVLGEVYQQIELSFAALVRLAFSGSRKPGST